MDGGTNGDGCAFRHMKQRQYPLAPIAAAGKMTKCFFLCFLKVNQSVKLQNLPFCTHDSQSSCDISDIVNYTFLGYITCPWKVITVKIPVAARSISREKIMMIIFYYLSIQIFPYIFIHYSYNIHNNMLNTLVQPTVWGNICRLQSTGVYLRSYSLHQPFYLVV